MAINIEILNGSSSSLLTGNYFRPADYIFRSETGIFLTLFGGTGNFASDQDIFNLQNQLNNTSKFQISGSNYLSGNIVLTGSSQLSVGLSGGNTIVFNNNINTGELTGQFVSRNETGSYYPRTNPSGYLNSASGVVRTTGDQTISGDKTFKDASNNTTIRTNVRKLYDTFGLDSIDWSGRVLHAGDNLPSVDWGNGILRENVFGEVCVDWYSRILSDGATTSVNWGSRALHSTDGIYPSVDWGARRLNNSSDIATVDWSACELTDIDEYDSLNWNGRTLKDSLSFDSLDWDARTLKTAGGQDSLNWAGREARSANTALSIDWENRQLSNSSADTVVDWQAGTLVSTLGAGVTVDFQNHKLYDTEGDESYDWEGRNFPYGFSSDAAVYLTAQGTDWAAIGDTEAVTKAAVEASFTPLTRAPIITDLNFSNPETTATNGGTAINRHGQSTQRSTTTLGSYAVSRFYIAGAANNTEGDTISFSRPLFLGVMYSTSGPEYRDGVGDIWLGGAYNLLPTANPAYKAIGWRIEDETFKAVMVNNAGTYSVVNTSASYLSATASTRQKFWLAIASDGTGNVTWYVNGTAIATTNGGPTGVTNTLTPYLVISSYADATLGQYNDCSIISMSIGEQY